MGVASKGLQGVLVLCAVLWAVTGHARRAEVELLAQAEVATPRYCLGDIARIEAADERQRRRLQELVIADTPALGQTKTYTRQGMERKVVRRHPDLRGLLRWRGAEIIVVRGKGQRVASDTLVDAAALELARFHGERYKSLELRPVGEVPPLQAPLGDVDLRARPLPADGVTRRVGVHVDVRVDGKHYRTVPVWFDGRAVQSVLTAKHPRRAGEPLRMADFDWTALDVATYASGPVPAEELMSERLRLRRPLSAGEPLLREHVEERPAVARNDNVKVAVSQGGIVIEASGIALADARIGEAVKIRNPDSNEQFAALVVAPGVVRIEVR